MGVKKLKCGLRTSISVASTRLLSIKPFKSIKPLSEMFPCDSFLRAFHYDSWQMDVLGELCASTKVYDLPPPPSLWELGPAENLDWRREMAQWILRHPRARQVLVNWVTGLAAEPVETFVAEAEEFLSVVGNHIWPSGTSVLGAPERPLVRTEAQVVTILVLRFLRHDEETRLPAPEPHVKAGLHRLIMERRWLSRIFHMADIEDGEPDLSPRDLLDLYRLASRVHQGIVLSR